MRIEYAGSVHDEHMHFIGDPVDAYVKQQLRT